MSETFARVEKKYLLDVSQYEKLMELLKDHVVPDKFFESDIQSIYYDTNKFQLIRRSIEKPLYKEKLRVRSYKPAEGDDMVFVELKKKYDGTVFKRRTEAKADEVLKDIRHCEFKDKQVGEEIRYALQFYDELKPAIYIGCKRSSYAAKDDERLRITFDSDIRYRLKHLALKPDEGDKPVTDKVVMELKVSQAMPLWLTEILDEVHAYPRGFSKVGTAFLKELGGK